MCCFFTSLVVFGARAAAIFWWIVQPGRWDVAFSSWVWPVVGIIFAPWTTMSYVLVAPAGVNGLDWFWIVLGVLADIASWVGGGYGNRDRIPGASSAS